MLIDNLYKILSNDLTKKTTFFDEGKGNFWRLQDKINGSGFVDYIDIYF